MRSLRTFVAVEVSSEVLAKARQIIVDLSQSEAEVSWEAKFFGLLYPAGDLLLLFALIGGVARGWFAHRNPVVASLLVGIGLFIAADLGFAYELGNAIFLISRLPGLIAHAHEERTRQSPMRQIDPKDHDYDGARDRRLPEGRK